MSVSDNYMMLTNSDVHGGVQVLWDSVAGGDDWCVPGQAVVGGLLQVVSSLVDPTVPGLARRGRTWRVVLNLMLSSLLSCTHSSCVSSFTTYFFWSSLVHHHFVYFCVSFLSTFLIISFWCTFWSYYYFSYFPVYHHLSTFHMLFFFSCHLFLYFFV